MTAHVFNALAEVTDAAGVTSVAADATVEVRDATTGALATVYTDRSESGTYTNPGTGMCDANGRVEFYVRPGRYDITVTKDGQTITWDSVVPASGVVARGSNSNGEYVRFADGTQICWAEGIPFDNPISGRIEGTWTYPAAFSESPSVFFAVGEHTAGEIGSTAPSQSNEQGLKMVAVSNSVIGTTSVTGRLTSSINFTSGDNVFMRGLAIGRWD